MDFGIGIGIASASDSWKLARRAEELGFTHAWFYDTQMITADRFVAMAAAGPRAATLLHRAADVDQQGWDNTMQVPEEGIAKAIEGYVEMARHFTPSDARYLQNHRGHFVFVKPEERPFVTAELIRRTTFTATAQELTQRVEALRAAGWDQLVIPITPGEEHAIEDWARIKDAFA